MALKKMLALVAAVVLVGGFVVNAHRRRFHILQALGHYPHFGLLFNSYRLINKYCFSNRKWFICLTIVVTQLHGIGIPQQRRCR